VQTYYNPDLYKTDAPVSVIYDIFKTYKIKSAEPDYLKKFSPTSPGFRILSKETKVTPDFEFKCEKKKSGKNVVKKYLPNPTRNWGPKARATGNK